MGRNVTIAITNRLGSGLTFSSDHIEHGKFEEGQEPPETIADGGVGTFQAGNRTGAKIGPKGSVTYTFIAPDSSSAELIVTWNHPFSAATSAYSAYSNPVGIVSYTQDPAEPSGHDQSISLTVDLA